MRDEDLLTARAEHDLESIHTCLAGAEGGAAADRVLERLLDLADSLAKLPQRGNHPRALLDLGIREFRQVFLEPYGEVYRVVHGNGFIVLIADGRRDMQTLLARRLLGAQ